MVGPETCDSSGPAPIHAWESCGALRAGSQAAAAREGWRRAGVMGMFLTVAQVNAGRWVGGPLDEAPSPHHAPASMGRSGGGKKQEGLVVGGS